MTAVGAPAGPRIKVGFVLHVMQVAGAEVLVTETIRRLRDRLEPTVLCLDAVGPLGEQLRSEGVPVLSFDRTPGLQLGVSRRMAHVIRERRLDVLHCHQYTPFFYGGIAARLSGVHPRVIFTEHGRHYPDVVSSKRRWVNRMLLERLADEVNAVCEFSAGRLRELDGFRRRPIAVIENGIDVERYGRAASLTEARRALGLDPARKYVAIVARFHPVKDHHTLLEAFHQVAKQRPDAELLLIGDGPLRAELEAQVVALGIRNAVRFLGVRRDVAALLSAVDVFTLTSLSEAASLTLLEAMASALPVVVTRVGGNPEIVRHGVDGLLVPRGDAGAIGAAITRLLDDDSLARRLGESGAERARTLYRLDRTISRYWDLYAAGRVTRARAA